MWRQRMQAIASAGAGASVLAAGTLWSWSGRTSPPPASGSTKAGSIEAPHASAAATTSSGGHLCLRQVQVFFRHGARTPINIIPNVKQAIYDRDVFMRPLPFMNYDLPVVDLDGNTKPGLGSGNALYSRVLEGGSNVGQLTTYGMQQSYELGLRLRRRYVDDMRFLDVSQEGLERDSIYVRSTFILRTMLTAKALLAGLLNPAELTSQAKPPVSLHVSDHSTELLYPNFSSCPCLRDIVHHGLDNLHEVPGLDQVRRAVFEAVGYADGIGATHGHKHMQLTEFRDDVVARLTHGLPVPAELQPYIADIDKFGTISCLYGLIGTISNQQLGLRLASGPLMHHIVNNMDCSLKNESPKFHLYSVHDSTIMPLLTAMKVFDGKWPPFCSELTFELYMRSAGDGGAEAEPMVKVKYQGQDLELPGCTGATCSLSQFKQLLSDVTVRQEERHRLCHPPAADDTTKNGEIELATGM